MVDKTNETTNEFLFISFGNIHQRKKVKKVDEFSIQEMYKEDPEIQVLTKCSNGSMFDFGVSIIL